MEVAPETQLRDRITFDIEADGSTRGLAHVREVASVVKDNPAAGFHIQEGERYLAEDSEAPVSDPGSHTEEHVVVDIRVVGPEPEKTKGQVLLEEDFYTLPFWIRLRIYFYKMKGGLDQPLPIPPLIDCFWAWLGAFLGILLLAGLNEWLQPRYSLEILVASFGATAVLVFGVPDSKLAQPRNVMGGHLISAVIGCAVRLVLGDVLWLSGALGMSLALAAMMATRTIHPPGGATALIAAIASPMLPWAGFEFVVSIIIGCAAILLVALIVNNLHRTIRYPTFWW